MVVSVDDLDAPSRSTNSAMAHLRMRPAGTNMNEAGVKKTDESMGVAAGSGLSRNRTEAKMSERKQVQKAATKVAKKSASGGSANNHGQVRVTT